jgi:hypothetical protein
MQNIFAEPRSSRITRIVYGKKNNSPQHEFLQIQFKVPATRDSGQLTGWLLVERRCSDKEDHGTESVSTFSNRSNTHSQTTSSNASVGSIISLSSALSSPRAADDSIILVQNSPKDNDKVPPVQNAKSLGEIRCTTESSLSALDFALLLQTVSRSAPQYDVLNKNCFWYAGAVYDIVKEYNCFKERDSVQLSGMKADDVYDEDKAKRGTLYNLGTGNWLRLNKSGIASLRDHWEVEVKKATSLKTRQEVSLQ